MKFYISADIEGVTGVTSWNETVLNDPEHKEAAYQMTREVEAACLAINSMGEAEILIKDAHMSGRNLDHRLLPKNTKLIRGWSGSPFSMMQELDGSFDGVIFIGYHSPVTSGDNPLAHTMNASVLEYIKLNGEILSELRLNSYMAAYYDLPVLFVSGDRGICEEAKSINEKIETVAVKEGKGNSTINIHPDLALEKIEAGVRKSLENISSCGLGLPDSFNLEIRYREHGMLETRVNYPGARKLDSKTLSVDFDNYLDVIRAMKFLV